VGAIACPLQGGGEVMGDKGKKDKQKKEKQKQKKQQQAVRIALAKQPAKIP